MKVDLTLDAASPASAGQIARAAEALGFDAIWFAETAHDPFIAAGLALAATRRITVGTGIAVAFARSPVVLAQSAFDLAALGGCRFALGLGTQVRGHVERRFGMPWSAPAPRLQEWIGGIRAAWSSWQYGTPFRYEGEHVRLSLMTPFFSPPPLEVPPAAGTSRIPLSVAGVGPGLIRLAGRHAEGFQVHPLHTRIYLADTVVPGLQQGEALRADHTTRSEADGRDLAAVAGSRTERIVPVFLAPMEDPAAVEEVRRRISFYASTPSYRRVLATHGREHAGERLSRLAAAGHWDRMAAEIDDEFLAEVAVVGPVDALGDLLAARCAGIADRVLPLLPLELAPDGEPRDRQRWERLLSTLHSA